MSNWDDAGSSEFLPGQMPRRLRGWTPVPSVVSVVARAELAYWNSLTPEEQAIETELRDRRQRGTHLKSASEVLLIRAQQSRVLGIDAGGDFEAARGAIRARRDARGQL